jgi:putative ABC transport system permease protein
MLGDKVTLFKERLEQIPQVEAVSVGDYLPVRGTKRNGNQFYIEGRQKIDKSVPGQFWQADEDYLKVMKMKLVEGRNFNPDLESDKDAVIINQRMAKELGLKNPVGARISNHRSFTVIGIVEDFHFDSFKNKIEPLAISFETSPTIVSARIDNGQNPSNVIQSIMALWKEMAPHQPIRYTFLDQSYARMYDDVNRMARVFTSCAVFAIIVACLGLFGLSASMTEQRSKEISIRLVLGASMSNVLQLVMQNFLWLIIVSFVLSTPIAWFIMDKWLQDYEYRIDITWDVFALAGIMAVVIALATISYQSVRAALINPVNNLRSE